MLDAVIGAVTDDISGALIQLFFAYTIILMVLDKQKPPVQTSVLTGVALITLSLGGSFTSIVTAGIVVVNGLLWLFIGYQRFVQDKG